MDGCIKKPANDFHGFGVKSIEKIRRLSWRQKQLVMSSLVLLPFCALSLKASGFAATKRRLVPQAKEPRSGNTSNSLDQAREIAAAVAIAAKFLPGLANCLARSLVLSRYLQIARIEHDLRLGGKTSGKDFSAHAWVEHEGSVLNDREDVAERFAPFV
jgi:hypothetical protein